MLLEQPGSSSSDTGTFQMLCCFCRPCVTAALSLAMLISVHVGSAPCAVCESPPSSQVVCLCLLPVRRLETHLVSLKPGSKSPTGRCAAPALTAPKQESLHSICCTGRSFLTQLLAVRQCWCLTDVISVGPDEMCFLAEGSILAAS